MEGDDTVSAGTAAADRYVESLLDRIDGMREIGRPSSVAHLIGIVEHRLEAGSDEVARIRLEDAKEWLSWATEYEAANGPESLLDRSHPVHQWALAEIGRIEDLRMLMGRAPPPASSWLTISARRFIRAWLFGSYG